MNEPTVYREVTRAEHMTFCKERALEYLDRGDVQNGITSMLSDLSKHAETKSVGEAMGPVGFLAIMNKDLTEAYRFVKGFA